MRGLILIVLTICQLYRMELIKIVEDLTVLCITELELGLVSIYFLRNLDMK